MRLSYLCMTMFAAIFFLTGCGRPTGILYTHITKPLDTNMSQTPSGVNSAEGDIKHLTIYNISVLWDSNAIGDIAKNSGLETVYYADLEELNVLGVWKQYTIHIYGK
ncbi:MAG: hypothetical protein GY737_04270 [Desulfobacteraceae bacterium]|nr:hypothetical protein [Desulfobacteraceae bacterium]